jgi:hypothetical protein
MTKQPVLILWLKGFQKDIILPVTAKEKMTVNVMTTLEVQV